MGKVPGKQEPKTRNSILQKLGGQFKAALSKLICRAKSPTASISNVTIPMAFSGVLTRNLARSPGPLTKN